MFAVIFRAEIGELDQEYSELAGKLRQLAMDKYGCVEFFALCEGNQEVAISYWPDMTSIQAWKADPLHAQAQKKGRAGWYNRYLVKVAEIHRQYQVPAE